MSWDELTKVPEHCPTCGEELRQLYLSVLGRIYSAAVTSEPNSPTDRAIDPPFCLQCLRE